MIPAGRHPALAGADGARADDGPEAFTARLRARRAALIDALLRELVPVASPAYSSNELSIHLTELVDRLIALLKTIDDQTMNSARQIGRELADLLYWSTEGLERTHAVLSDVLIDAVPAGRGDSQRAVARVRTAIISGYHERTRKGVVDEQASMIRALVTSLDTTRGELEESRARFDSVFKDSALGIWMGDLEGRTLEANQALLDLLGMRMDDLRATDVTLLVHPDDRGKFGPLWTGLISGRMESFQEETRYLHKAGFPVWGHLTVTLVRDIRGEPVYIVAMLQDIGEQRRLEEKLRRSDEHLRSLVQNSGDLIAVVNARGEGTYFSPASFSMLGYRPDELLNQRIWPLLVAGSLSEIDAFWERLRAQPGEPLDTQLRLRHKDGSLRWIGMVCTNRLDDPSIQGVVMNARDITAQKDLEAELIRNAHTDDLTGLANRRDFTTRLGRALAEGQRVGVLFADLDRFKVINDSLGHDIGDEALKAMAGRFATCAGEQDMVARIGGDEFAVLLVDTDEERAWATAQQMLKVMRDPVTLQQHQTILSTSIGIALSGPGLGHPEALLRAADLALYRAKADGRAVAAVFEPEMHEAAMTRLELEADLGRALRRGELFVAYQPEVDLRTGRVVALEALVRWQHPTRGLVPPDDFVEIAEETGQIIPIGQWVMAEACQQMRQWRAAGEQADGIILALNLTSRELRQDGFISQISRCLQAGGLAPEDLCLEVSERLLTDDVAAATPVLHTLRGLGVQIAVDDFGAGYTSITSWPALTANLLKLDRSLTSRVGQGQNGVAFIKAFTTLAHTLRLQVCAEGIETAARLQQLREAGCDHGQGYYFAPALRPEDVPAFLARRDLHLTPATTR